jgi:hypothetical protein
MTCNRDLACDDLFGCDHSPEFPIVESGEIIEWFCRCGREANAPTEPNPERRPIAMTPEVAAAIAARKPAAIAVIEDAYDGIGRVWICKDVDAALARAEQCMPLPYPNRNIELVLFDDVGEEIERFCEY